jgi:hypothetical protein
MTDYQFVVALILGATALSAAIIAIIAALCGKSITTDPYSEEFPGVSAPREE